MDSPDPRRPIAARSSGWAQSFARRLGRTGITPNQISIASMACALLAGSALVSSADQEAFWRALLLLTGAAMIQFRLLCNLFDGMVAVEGGKGTSDGPFWNEAPDRISDIFILVGFSGAAGQWTLGWVAAALAISTAYVRELGRANGAGAVYSGPMAKQHRMALVTVALVIACIEPVWGWQGDTITIALWVLIAGTAMTAIIRSWTVIRRLKSPDLDRADNSRAS